MKNSKVAFITGITGFAGSHLADLLLKKGYQVHGLCRWRSRSENIEHIKRKIHLVEGDLLDLNSLQQALMDVRPNLIFHLAAQSFVPASWTSPAVTLEINIVGSCNLFEAIRAAQIDPTIQIVRTRGFNHEGPRRGEVFVCSTFAKQIAEIEKGRREPVVQVGNLSAKRDFTDVRDMVNGYLLAALKGEPGEVYNICSGRTLEIKTILKMLLEMTKIKVKIEQDPSRMRPSDVPVLLGDCSKFRRQTGWKPKIPFEKTLKDLLDFWRERV